MLGCTVVPSWNSKVRQFIAWLKSHGKGVLQFSFMNTNGILATLLTIVLTSSFLSILDTQYLPRLELQEAYAVESTQISDNLKVASRPSLNTTFWHMHQKCGTSGTTTSGSFSFSSTSGVTMTHASSQCNTQPNPAPYAVTKYNFTRQSTGFTVVVNGSSPTTTGWCPCTSWGNGIVPISSSNIGYSIGEFGGNWFFIENNGSTQNTTQFGSGFSANTIYTMKIKINSTGAFVKVWKPANGEPTSFNFTTTDLSEVSTTQPYPLWVSGSSLASKAMTYKDFSVVSESINVDKSIIWAQFGSNTRYDSSITGRRNGQVASNGTWIWTIARDNSAANNAVIGMKISDGTFKTCTDASLPGTWDIEVGSDNLLNITSQGSAAILKLNFDSCTFTNITPAGAGNLLDFANPAPTGFQIVNDRDGATTTGLWKVYPNGTGVNYPHANATTWSELRYYPEENEVWMADFTHKSIVKFDLDTNTYTNYFKGDIGTFEPVGLARVGDTFYVSDRYQYRIIDFDIDTGIWGTAKTVPNHMRTNFAFIGGTGMAVVRSGINEDNKLSGYPIFALSTSDSAGNPIDGVGSSMFIDEYLIYNTTSGKFAYANTKLWQSGFYGQTVYSAIAPCRTDPADSCLWVSYHNNPSVDDGTTDQTIGFSESM